WAGGERLSLLAGSRCPEPGPGHGHACASIGPHRTTGPPDRPSLSGFPRRGPRRRGPVRGVVGPPPRDDERANRRSDLRANRDLPDSPNAALSRPLRLVLSVLPGRSSFPPGPYRKWLAAVWPSPDS